MIRAMFPGSVFMPKQRQVKVKMKIHARDYQADINALIDSGATDNFICPTIVNRFNLPIYNLSEPKIIRNVDGTKNSIGSVHAATNLKVTHNGKTVVHGFFIIDLGGDSMLLGMPFLAAHNPVVDWTNGRLHGQVSARTADAHLWTPQRQKRHLAMRIPDDLESEDEDEQNFIPNSCGGHLITHLYAAGRRVTRATELAIQALRKEKLPWQKQVPKEYHHYSKVFCEKEATRFPKSRPWDHAIELLPDAPTTLDCKVYPLAPAEQTALNEFLKDHLSKGYIRRSNSPYASPFFFVKKKDGKLRPVQDYRRLNEWTVQNKYPLPLIKELVAKLARKSWFTKLDIRWGYNNVRLKREDQWKAAFKTNKGLFEPTVMFFGLTNSPATFQMMMDDLFSEEMATGDVVIYMDDILIATAGSIDQHRHKVAHILSKLQSNDLFLKPEKCTFHRKEVEYLGVIVGNNEVKMDPIKVAGIAQWPTPASPTQLRSFLGFGNYYKDFIANYSLITRPLHDMTKRARRWKWEPAQEAAFQTLKQLFTSYPVLRNADHSKRFIVDTDASAHAVGATISQDFSDGRHPVAYFSKSLSPPERNYDIYDRELLSIIYAIKAFRYLLLGAQHKFLIRTDHNNLKYFRSAKQITPRQARWHEFLQDYDFELEHIPGKSNTIADLLSRREDLKRGVKINDSVTILPETLFAKRALTRRVPSPTRRIPNAFVSNKDFFTRLIPDVKALRLEGITHLEKISIDDKFAAHKTYLDDNPETRRQILYQVHDTPIGGHPGISNTWKLINRHYEGPRLHQFVEQYVKGCAKCQESKVITHVKRAPLYPFDTHIEEGPFKYVSMDLITDLPLSHNYDAILTIVDQGCSKAAKFLPCRKTIDGQGVATLYLRHLFPLFGVPKRIISDRDTRFTSHFSKAVCKATHIQQNFSTAFHPRTDGQSERMNQWIETYLRNFVNGRQDNWSDLLPIAEFTHNSWTHEATKHSPHELITGSTPSAKITSLDDSVPSAQNRLLELAKARIDAQKSLNHRIKNPRNHRTLEVNQQVWLDARNLHVNTPSKKLSPRRYGPFKVIKQISKVAYQLKLPPSMRIHDVFHIDRLIPFVSTEAYGAAYSQPPPELIDGEEEYEVEEIIRHRVKGKKRKTNEYFVSWKGYPSSENSWVKESDFHAPELLEEYQRSRR